MINPYYDGSKTAKGGEFHRCENGQGCNLIPNSCLIHPTP